MLFLKNIRAGSMLKYADAMLSMSKGDWHRILGKNRRYFILLSGFFKIQVLKVC